ncbi:MAG: class I SAM-dependent methyltransferase [Candidatus Thermoplasmatota archaeon]
MSPKLLLARLAYWLLSFKENPHEVFNRIGVEKEDHILEIGCAIGFHTFPLADLAEEGHIYAVDISEEFIDFLEKKRKKKGYENITPICEDAEKIGLKNEKLDKVVCFRTIHDMQNPEKALENWLSHLRSGSLLLYRDPEISIDSIIEYSEEELVEVDEIEDVHLFRKK